MSSIANEYLPVVQASMNVAASLGACAGPLIIGALTKANGHTGWRNFYVSLYGHLDMFTFVLTSSSLVDPDGTVGRLCSRPLLWL